MRYATFSIIGTFFAAVFIMAMWPSDARFGAPSTSIAQDDIAAPKTKKIRASKLNRIARERLCQEWSPNIKETSFLDVMHDIAKEYKINIVLDETARNDSLTGDTPVTFSASNVPLRNGMRLLLKRHNATYVVRDGIVRIISMDVAKSPEFLAREIISCRKLLQLIASNEKRRVDQLNSKRKTAGKRTAKATPNEYYIDKTLAAEHFLIPLIRTTISPSDWEDTNGEGTIRHTNGGLVVSQTQETIDDIHVLLDQLTNKLKTTIK